MAKYDRFEIKVQVGQLDAEHVYMSLSVLYEDGDDIDTINSEVTNKLLDHALDIADSGKVRQLDRAN